MPMLMKYYSQFYELFEHFIPNNLISSIDDAQKVYHKEDKEKVNKIILEYYKFLN
jgi:hypothetical protein